MSQAVETLLSVLLFKYVVCHITGSMKCYFIKTGVTYSHSTKKFSIQVRYHSKMYNCIAIKISWYTWIEGNFFSSDLYEAKQIIAFKNDLLQPFIP